MTQGGERPRESRTPLMAVIAGVQDECRDPRGDTERADSPIASSQQSDHRRVCRWSVMNAVLVGAELGCTPPGHGNAVTG